MMISASRATTSTAASATASRTIAMVQAINPRGLSFTTERPLHRRERIVVCRKSDERILLCDHVFSYPDRELAAAAFDELNIGTDGLLDERRHTGGSRTVVSDLAVANLQR